MIVKGIEPSTTQTNWKKEIETCMKGYGETWNDIVSMTMTEEEALVEFDKGYGVEEGIPFTAWTTYRVYFPVCYDGAEWVGSVSRNPNGVRTRHHGGG